ncbi:MAG TPA: ABC transporter permease [Myxococcales bacterium]|jgi:ABC-2 type transport system permease protein
MNRLGRFFIRVGALAGKEAIHIRRDIRTLYLALGMPVVMLLLFGYGVSFDIDHIPVALVDNDHSDVSREIARTFFASNEIASTGEPVSEPEAEKMLRLGHAMGFLTIPVNAGRDLLRGEGIQLQLAVDGRDGVTANQLLAKADALALSVGAKLTGASTSAKPPLSVKVWTRYNPEGRSALFLVPGLAAYLMAIVSVLLTALTIATEWERGSMEQLFASPVGRLEIILGKLLPYLVIGMLALLLVLSVGTWVFDVPIRGSVPLLFGAGMVFLVSMLSQGLLISVVTKNQLVATQAGALSSLLPSLLLSGFMFPIENMPRILQVLSSVIPAKYMVHTLRGVMLKGAGFDTLWPDFASMAAFAVFALIVATKKFSRRLA